MLSRLLVYHLYDGRLHAAFCCDSCCLSCEVRDADCARVFCVKHIQGHVPARRLSSLLFKALDKPALKFCILAMASSLDTLMNCTSTTCSEPTAADRLLRAWTAAARTE